MRARNSAPLPERALQHPHDLSLTPTAGMNYTEEMNRTLEEFASLLDYKEPTDTIDIRAHLVYVLRSMNLSREAKRFLDTVRRREPVIFPLFKSTEVGRMVSASRVMLFCICLLCKDNVRTAGCDIWRAGGGGSLFSTACNGDHPLSEGEYVFILRTDLPDAFAAYHPSSHTGGPNDTGYISLLISSPLFSSSSR